MSDKKLLKELNAIMPHLMSAYYKLYLEGTGDDYPEETENYKTFQALQNKLGTRVRDIKTEDLNRDAENSLKKLNREMNKKINKINEGK